MDSSRKAKESVSTSFPVSTKGIAMLEESDFKGLVAPQFTTDYLCDKGFISRCPTIREGKLLTMQLYTVKCVVLLCVDVLYINWSLHASSI